jgi:uncharacterized phage infection (PIP) family protein YhgE
MPDAYKKSLIILPILLLGLWVPATMADSANSAPATASDVQRELKETLQTIASYSAEQRVAAVAKAKEALAKTDERIDQLQQHIEQNWQSMNQEAREQSRESLKALQKQRTEIAEWYGGLKHSSANAWDEIKKGFANSYNELEKSLEKAREKF